MMQVLDERNFEFLANFLATFATNLPYKREFEVRIFSLTSNAWIHRLESKVICLIDSD